MPFYDCYSEHGRNAKLKKEFQFRFLGGEPLAGDYITTADEPRTVWKIVRRQWKSNGRLILIVARPHGVVLA